MDSSLKEVLTKSFFPRYSEGLYPGHYCTLADIETGRVLVYAVSESSCGGSCIEILKIFNEPMDALIWLFVKFKYSEE